jgi:hypothetical protein
MIDSQTAVQLAVFAALKAATDVTSLADVWQNPPEGTEPGEKGLVLIGLVSLAGDANKEGGLDEATCSVFTQVRKPDATFLYALNVAVRNALERQTISADGADISEPWFVSANPRLMDDGVTYEDELRFGAFVQAA